MAKASVIMPVYNGEKYLREAINSILHQTFSDFEFLIVNDGSTDHSLEIIGSFSDPRIRVVHHEKNLGLIASLNQAFEMATGEYIIRMDCDDIALRTRIEKQTDFLDCHPSIGVVGTFCKTIGSQSKALYFPVNHESIRISTLFECPIAHPTVALRRSIIPTPAFDSRFLHAEDYELWSRLLGMGIRFHTLPESLLYYRIHEQQISSIARTTQLATGDVIRAHWLSQLGIKLSEKELMIHRMIAHSSYRDTIFDPISVCDHLERLLDGNERYSIFDRQIFFRDLSDRNLHAFSCSNSLSKKQFFHFNHSRLWRPNYFLKKNFYKTYLARMRGLTRMED